MGAERVQKILARAGIASRRGAEELIRKGRVTVDGRPVSLGDKADVVTQTVKVDGRRVQLPAGNLYLLLNKPRGYLTTRSDPQGRPTVYDLVPRSLRKRLFPVGRLDYDSEGLLVLTDTGWLQNRISDPKHKLPKTYWVQVERVPDDDAFRKLAGGVTIKGKKTKPAEVRRLGAPDVWNRTPPIRYRKNVPDTWLELKLREGRNRQVRRMTAAVGHPTLRLIRYAVGPWHLGSLQPGEWIEVEAPRSEKELARMLR